MSVPPVNPLVSASLRLEDGSSFHGYSFGAEEPTHGEVVFNTGMTGYQEVLTDPSYAGQIVVSTYPLIGNYGVNEQDFESSHVQVSGFVVRDYCDRPSHPLSTSTLNAFLSSQGIPGISGVDTRAITRRLRTHGVMMGSLTFGDQLQQLDQFPRYGDVDFVSRVTTKKTFVWDAAPIGQPPPKRKIRIVITDCGLKYNIMRILSSRGCEVIAVPGNSSADYILDHGPDGVVLSPGPGDPQLLDYAVETTVGLIGKVPILGICLGNQILARAFGGKTFKLKFGHRGANHPVRDLTTGRVYITAQNHGYAVDPSSLPPEIEVSHVNLNDGTVEGLKHRSLPVMGIQYHSEASPGPLDNEYIFDDFVGIVCGSDA